MEDGTARRRGRERGRVGRRRWRDGKKEILWKREQLVSGRGTRLRGGGRCEKGEKLSRCLG